MNESFKEALAASVPEQMPDPRDQLFRSEGAEPANQPGGPAESALVSSSPTGPEAIARQQEKQRKVEALQPLA